MKNASLNLQKIFLNKGLQKKGDFKNSFYFILFFIFLLLSGCCSLTTKIPDPFPKQFDVILGKSIRDGILNNPATYPILDMTINQEIYAYVSGLSNTILNSGNIENKDIFHWEVRIIKNDAVINAFACPGGYIFVYTGLLKFCESEDEFIGVLGHEMAHADNRHSTQEAYKNTWNRTIIQDSAGRSISWRH